MHTIPHKRGLVESNLGRIGGLAGRIRFNPELSETYPNLVMVPEPATFLAWCAYTKDSKLRFSSWKDLADQDLTIAYPRGNLLSEKKLHSHVKTENIHTLTDTFQGLKMLKHGRIDVLIAHPFTVDSFLTGKEFMGSNIASVGILEKVSVFPYLHKKHRALIPKLAAILKTMKEDGSYKHLAKESKNVKKPSDSSQ